MAKQLLPVIDSNGIFSKRRATWVRKQAAGGLGAFDSNGVFVFGAKPPERAVIYGLPGSRATSLIDRLWEARIDSREFPVDSAYWDGRGCFRFWADQSSHGKSTGLRQR